MSLKEPEESDAPDAAQPYPRGWDEAVALVQGYIDDFSERAKIPPFTPLACSFETFMALKEHGLPECYGKSTKVQDPECQRCVGFVPCFIQNPEMSRRSRDFRRGQRKKQDAQREKYLNSMNLSGPKNTKIQGAWVRLALHDRIKPPEMHGVKDERQPLLNVRKPGAELLLVGVRMETELNMLKAVNLEVEESRKIFQALANDVTAVGGVISPLLLKQAQELRTARMTVVTEIQQALTAMRDVRAFFLESNYEVEVARLERFVKLCRELQALKASGLFDAVCDSALRLAIQEAPGDSKS